MTRRGWSAQPVRLLAQAVREMWQTKSASSPRIICVSSYHNSSDFQMHPCVNSMREGEQTLAQWGSDPNSGQAVGGYQPRITDLGSDPHWTGHAGGGGFSAEFWRVGNEVEKMLKGLAK